MRDGSGEQRAWQPLPLLTFPYVGQTNLADAAEHGGTENIAVCGAENAD